MNEIVDTLKEDKEQIEFKLQKYENLIKCQKLEIESKSSLLKQYELVSISTDCIRSCMPFKNLYIYAIHNFTIASGAYAFEKNIHILNIFKYLFNIREFKMQQTN